METIKREQITLTDRQTKLFNDLAQIRQKLIRLWSQTNLPSEKEKVDIIPNAIPSSTNVDKVPLQTVETESFQNQSEDIIDDSRDPPTPQSPPPPNTPLYQTHPPPPITYHEFEKEMENGSSSSPHRRSNWASPVSDGHAKESFETGCDDKESAQREIPDPSVEIFTQNMEDNVDKDVIQAAVDVEKSNPVSEIPIASTNGCNPNLSNGFRAQGLNENEKDQNIHAAGNESTMKSTTHSNIPTESADGVARPEDKFGDDFDDDQDFEMMATKQMEVPFDCVSNRDSSHVPSTSVSNHIPAFDSNPERRGMVHPETVDPVT